MPRQLPASDVGKQEALFTAHAERAAMVYVAAETLAAEGLAIERRKQRVHTVYAEPELLAIWCNEV